LHIEEKEMNKKILSAGFACLSVIAVAQSSGSKDQAATAAQTKDQHPRDVATGQASGKNVNKPAGSQAVLNSSDQVTAPRDLATGQASGKRQYQPITIRKVTDDDPNAVREAQSPKATGKTTAQGDWHATTKTGNTSVSPADVNHDGAAVRESPSSPSKGQMRVATGDVNGDGKADAAINNSHSNIKNGRDLATGQATGKRQPQNTDSKDSGTASQK
jgi:hypothetical protein